MYDKILVPTDGSEGTRKAVNHALAIAEKFGSELNVVYVINTSAYSTLPAEANWESVTSALRKEGRAATSGIIEEAEGRGVDVEKSIKEGVPHREILEYVDEEDIDLVVMGTHGKTGLDRFLLGSVTEKVVRSCHQPVLTVKLSDDEMEDEGEVGEVDESDGNSGDEDTGD
ncbi:MAG: universal stress protein [Halobacteria archaeon]